MPTAAPGTVVIVDYLQLLDQKRSNPNLTEQVRHLKTFAKETGVVMVFVSQIYRNFDPKDKPTPTLDDVRLPNHLDLTLFDKACFLHDGEMGFASIG